MEIDLNTLFKVEINNNEKSLLLKCISERIITLRNEAKTFKELKEAASKGKPDDNMMKLIEECENVINYHQKEYLGLISIRTKLIRGETNGN